MSGTKIGNRELLDKILDEIVELYQNSPSLKLEHVICIVKYENSNLILKMDK